MLLVRRGKEAACFCICKLRNEGMGHSRGLDGKESVRNNVLCRVMVVWVEGVTSEASICLLLHIGYLEVVL